MLIMVNVDDVSGEIISYVINETMKKGAKSVNVIQTITKKGRPGYIFFIETEEKDLENISQLLFSELGTNGLKFIETTHKILNYNIKYIKIKLKDKNFSDFISVKLIQDQNSKILSVNAEFDEVQTVYSKLKSKYSNLSLIMLKKYIESLVLSGSREIEIDRIFL